MSSVAPHRQEPELRAFFSADLVGSTRLKNELNHQDLLEKYEARKKVLDKVCPPEVIPDQRRVEAVLESLAVIDEDFDWATVVESFYRDLHSEVRGHINKCEQFFGLAENSIELTPWKAVGDELIYQGKVASRRHLHAMVVAFLGALRAFDTKLGTRAGRSQLLRVKGTAWVAGFPVRNRKIMLSEIGDVPPDFLGPDIDTGFRIGKCARPGMLVVSVEMAELLSEVPKPIDTILAQIVGWQTLHGVWNDQRYPVIWVDRPLRCNDIILAAQPFSSWQCAECSWCAAWSNGPNPKVTVEAIATEIRELRKKLPKNLGLVDPYIIADPDCNESVPAAHEKIRELLELISNHQAKAFNQNAKEPTSSEKQVDTEQKIQALTEKIRTEPGSRTDA